MYSRNIAHNHWLLKVKNFLHNHNIKKILDENNGSLSLELRRVAAESNLLGLDASTGYGQNLNNICIGKIYEELGRCSINARELVGLGHGKIISDFGSKDQKAKYLPEIIMGNLLIGIGITEPGCGSDIASIQTTATLKGTKYILQGKKEWISRVNEAGVFIIFAKVLPANKLSAFIVDMKLPGISIFNKEPHGMKGWSFGGFDLKNVEIPKENILGDPGDAFHIFNSHFNYWRVLMTLLCIGGAESVLEDTIKYTRERQVFGGPLGRLQTVMHKIAESATKLEAAKLLCYSALTMADNKENTTKNAAMGKWYGTEVAYEAVNDMLQIYGARGYTKEFGIEQKLRDIRGLMIADGSNDVMKSLIGREIMGRDIYNLMYGRTLKSKQPIATTNYNHNYMN